MPEPNMLPAAISLEVEPRDDGGDYPFTDEEAEVVYDVVNSERPLEELIPLTIKPASLWVGFKAAAKGWRENQRAANRLKIALGRYLSIMKRNPEFLKAYGYRNWNDFVTNGVPLHMGVSRPEAFKVISAVETLPAITGDIVDQIRIGGVYAVAEGVQREINNGLPLERVPERMRYWIEAVKSAKRLDDVKAKIETENQLDKGELSRVACLISLRPITNETWEHMAADERIHSIVGSSDKDRIFAAMMAECLTEWIARAEEAQRAVPMAESNGAWAPEAEENATAVYQQ